MGIADMVGSLWFSKSIDLLRVGLRLGLFIQDDDRRSKR
jgi:hypothetical protein